MNKFQPLDLWTRFRLLDMLYLAHDRTFRKIGQCKTPAERLPLCELASRHWANYLRLQHQPYKHLPTTYPE